MEEEKEFWFKRPKDMTELERERLPLGPDFQCNRPWSIQEFVAEVAGPGTGVEWYESLETDTPAFDDDDLIEWTDARGVVFEFGRYKNGAWFKWLV